MTERFIHFVRSERPDPSETVILARERLKDRFPTRMSRRMTHLGLLVGASLDGLSIEESDSVVYATTYSETRALEDYLGSFPSASPLLFQTSIHPSAVQQVLIGRQQPVNQFWPITGKRWLVEHALATAMIQEPRTVLIGGEERGTWMLEQGLASGSAYAFALLFDRSPGGALGSVRMDPGGAGIDPCPSLEDLTQALAGKGPLSWKGPTAEWSLRWT